MIKWQASPELNILSHGQINCPWEKLLEIVPPGVLLIGGDSNMDWVYILISRSLVNVSSGEVKEVPSFQCDLKDGLPYLVRVEVVTWNLWQLLLLWSEGTDTDEVLRCITMPRVSCFKFYSTDFPILCDISVYNTNIHYINTVRLSNVGKCESSDVALM